MKQKIINKKINLTKEFLVRATKGKVLNSRGEFSVTGVTTDSRNIAKGDLFIAIKGDYFDGHSFLREAESFGAKALLVDREIDPEKLKGFSIPIIKVKDTVKAYGDIAHAYRMGFRIPFVAITGSSGKTTTKELTAKILSSGFNVLKNDGTENNHIGIPRTLLRLNSSHRASVLELGMNHLGEIDYLSRIVKPSIGVITNIGPAHLESLGNLNNVLKAKSELLKHIDKNGVLILNNDDPMLKPVIKKSSYKIMTFGINEVCDVRATEIDNFNDHIEFKVGKEKFRANIAGRHNVYNLLAAISVAKIFGIKNKYIKESISDFKMPSKRLNIKLFKKFVIIDDTYNANPVSVASAIDTIANYNAIGRRVFVLGDMLELGRMSDKLHSDTGKKIADSNIDILIGVGEKAKVTVDSSKRHGMDVAFSCRTNAEAFEILKDLVKENDIMLFKGSRRMKIEEIIDCFTTYYTR